MAEDVSVIIPAYNAGDTIAVCVESVLANDPLEVIVVDDASTDDTARIVEQLASARQGRVKLIRLHANRGPSHARNSGGCAARGSHLFFIDADTAMLPGALAQYIRRIGEADTVSGLYWWEPLNRALSARYKAMLNYHLFSRQGVFPYQVFNGAVGGMKAEVFRASGGWNEDLAWGMDYENEELGHRLWKHYRMLLDPAIAVKHRFPSFWKASRLYFTRVALWMELFARHRKFENGPASAGTGVGTVASPVMVLCFALSPWVSWLLIPGAVCAVLYLRAYGSFLVFVTGKAPHLLPVMLAFNLWFNSAIAAGACWGLGRALVGKGRIATAVVPSPAAAGAPGGSAGDPPAARSPLSR